MWTVLFILLLFLILIFIFEYRVRKPDQIVLLERNGKLALREGRLFPRHFSLALSRKIYSSSLAIDACAKGNIDIKVKLSVAVSASMTNIPQLIKVGGWNANAVSAAEKELETLIQGFVKEFTENFEIEELSSEKILNHLQQKINIVSEKLGLDIISSSVQSFEIIDQKIADAMRQRESARILEQTEVLNQAARINAAKNKIKADEEIAELENNLELKKIELKKSIQVKESELAQKKVEEELERKKMQLDYEKDELALLKNNPELLMLTPQAARLAEASQSLKNARTIVSLSPNDVSQGIDLISMFQKFLENAAGSQIKKNDDKKK